MKTVNLNFSTGYLNKLSHIKIGGLTKYLFVAKNVNDVLSAYRYAYEHSKQIIPVGGGTNILFGDTGDLIILPDRYLPKKMIVKGDTVIVSANYNINALIMNLSERGLGGLEFLAGIPAHIGGLAKMNAGAFGKTVFDFIKEIKTVDIFGDLKTLKKEQINFGYRFTDIQGFIYEITLQLKRKSESEIKNRINEFINIRKSKQPLEFPNLGSIFKNPENDFAGRLIEKSGLKGKKIGGAKVSEKHANFIVNIGDAKFKDMLNLINLVKDRVKENFNINLETEIRIIK